MPGYRANRHDDGGGQRQDEEKLIEKAQRGKFRCELAKADHAKQGDHYGEQSYRRRGPRSRCDRQHCNAPHEIPGLHDWAQQYYCQQTHPEGAW